MQGKYKNPATTLRVDPELLQKIRYIGELNGRSANREIELLMKARVKSFEDENGVIVLDNPKES